MASKIPVYFGTVQERVEKDGKFVYKTVGVLTVWERDASGNQPVLGGYLDVKNVKGEVINRKYVSLWDKPANSQ